VLKGDRELDQGEEEEGQEKGLRELVDYQGARDNEARPPVL
jgi:hypothetical protein